MLRHGLAVCALGFAAALASVAPAAAQRTVECADEGGFCRVPYPTTVYYGARGLTSARSVGGGGIACNNRTFGDPARGLVKRCSFVVRGERFEGRRNDERFERRRRDRD